MGIEAFVSKVCKILEISSPKLCVTDDMPTSTMMAYYCKDEDTLYYRETHKNEYDVYFSISHELRHKWQYEYYPSIFVFYKTSDKVSVDEYNSQEVELDANAFATVALEELLGITPLFNGLSDSVVEDIYFEADEMYKEMADKFDEFIE